MKRVDCVNLSKSYDQQNFVLQNISATIQPGEFFILVGPSGCGKSTMLRMIAGLESISSGNLYIGETEANNLPASKRGISMVFQNYALYPHLTVEDNIVFGLHVKKIPKQERLRKCREAAELLGLLPFLKRKPRELSGGQRQRVALARAIVTEAPICLMDEPLSNLDAKLRSHMRSELRHLQQKLGITMIYVTHDQVEAMTMGDRMMVMHNGTVQQIGTPMEIYNQPANTFVASFIGNPPMNLLEAQYAPHSGFIYIKGLHKLQVPGDVAFPPSIIAGVRPEHIRLADAARENDESAIVTLTNVELLGNETQLTFRLAEQFVHMKWHGQWRLRIGDQIRIALQFDDVTVFEKETGVLLKSARTEEQHTLGRGDLLCEPS
jgi:sn-glycerol 3-phosphate transport system ATP-binding protein